MAKAALLIVLLAVISLAVAVPAPAPGFFSRDYHIPFNACNSYCPGAASTATGSTVTAPGTTTATDAGAVAARAPARNMQEEFMAMQMSHAMIKKCCQMHGMDDDGYCMDGQAYCEMD